MCQLEAGRRSAPNSYIVLGFSRWPNNWGWPTNPSPRTGHRDHKGAFHPLSTHFESGIPNSMELVQLLATIGVFKVQRCQLEQRYQKAFPTNTGLLVINTHTARCNHMEDAGGTNDVCRIAVPTVVNIPRMATRTAKPFSERDLTIDDSDALDGHLPTHCQSASLAPITCLQLPFPVQAQGHKRKSLILNEDRGPHGNGEPPIMTGLIIDAGLAAGLEEKKTVVDKLFVRGRSIFGCS
ncbi:hypothetical protein B0H19DRAFT_1075807 [Mycena capillaripes]|nr:hypothetical protein B0H19DRAFT_1075807 [Mycena capillaripes]